MLVRRKFLGILTRKERWGFSARGSLVVFATVLLAFGALRLYIYSFLAVTDRVDANVLVVEGWIHGYAIRAAVREFQGSFCERVFTTGGPVEGTGGYVNDYQTLASVSADLLRKDGVPNDSVQMVPSRVMDRDRTYASAVALRKWFHAHKLSVRGINVLTEDVHARRTRLLFQKAFGDDLTVGVIAVPNPDYDSKHWWRYSEGVKDVFGEGIAYLYARFLFYPSGVSDVEKAAKTSQATRSHRERPAFQKRLAVEQAITGGAGRPDDREESAWIEAIFGPRVARQA